MASDEGLPAGERGAAMTTLNLWQCDTCARTYAADITTCTAPTCTNILPLSAKERLICDAFRRSGILDELVAIAQNPAALTRFALRLRGLAQLDREDLGEAIDALFELFVGHGLHKTGEAVEVRWKRLENWELIDKFIGHMEHADALDPDSGLPHYVHAAMRVLMRAQRAINFHRAKENAA